MHKKLYTALIAIAILIAIMAVQLIFGQNSIPRQQRVKENIARYQEEIDSLVNEMIIRRVKDLPVLTLLIDAQSGTAGIETRIESFLDIIAFRSEVS